jgi:hypothetical protein
MIALLHRVTSLIFKSLCFDCNSRGGSGSSRKFKIWFERAVFVSIPGTREENAIHSATHHSYCNIFIDISTNYYKNQINKAVTQLLHIFGLNGALLQSCHKLLHRVTLCNIHCVTSYNYYKNHITVTIILQNVTPKQASCQEYFFEK